MDYTVRDSTILQHSHSHSVRNSFDHSIRVGMIRKSVTLDSGDVRYIVDVVSGGRQVPVSCVFMTRFGGVHNFEEYQLRPWAQSFPTAALPGGSSASTHDLRSGDVVLVAYLEGQSREGVILGGLQHPAREITTSAGDIEYNSRFNGLETVIKKNGSYQVVFHGAATPPSELALKAPPTGASVPPPIFNPLIEGSFFGFSSTGSFIASDGSSQFIKVGKESKAVTIASGGVTITVSDTTGLLAIKSPKATIDSDSFLVKSSAISTESVTLSLKATQVSIGNDQIELVDGLLQLIDLFGGLTITSPVGLCTAFNLAPTWAAQVEPLKIKLSTLKASLQQPSTDLAFTLSADSDSDIA